MHDFLFYCLIPILVGIPTVIVIGCLALGFAALIVLIVDIVEKGYYRFETYMDARGGVSWGYVFSHGAGWLLFLVCLWMIGIAGLLTIFE